MNRTARLRVGPVCLLESRCNPVVIDFTLTTATSIATLGGSVNGAPIQEQAAGSLTTKYSGTLQADVDFTANTIQFIQAGTLVAANINGTWQPAIGGGAGSAPANYGGKINLGFPIGTAVMAPRGLVLTFESPVLTLTGTGASRTFTSNQTATITAGTTDYNAGLAGSGSQDLTGSSAINQGTVGTITDTGGGSFSLNIPLDVTINDTVGGLPATFTIKGAANATGVAPTAPAKIQLVQVNDGSAQRSSVTGVTVTFDQVVTLPANPADAFQLKRQSDNAVVTLAGSVTNSPTTAVTLTFTGGAVNGTSLADGRYTLTALASQVASGQFDGNSDGTAGDDFVLVGDPATAPKLVRFFGDNDGDGDVDAQDFGGFRAAFGGTSNLAFDFDGDGDVDAGDFGAFRVRFGGSV